MDVLRRFSDPHADQKIPHGELRVLGEKAADAYRTGGGTLSECVVSAIGDRPMGNQHVQRVVEFTNLGAFKHAYRSQPGPTRIVSFEGGPASAEDVLGRLRPPKTASAGSAGREEAVDMRPIDSGADPPASELVSLVREGLSGEKLATAGGHPVNWASVLRRLDEEISRRATGVAVLTEKQACALYDLCSSARREIIDHGLSLADLSRALDASVRNRPEMVKRAMDELLQVLAPSLGMDARSISGSMDKGASPAREVNTRHPLVLKAGTYIRALDELETAKHAEILLKTSRARLYGAIVRAHREERR